MLLYGPPIPGLAQWQDQMTQYGAAHATFIGSAQGTYDERLLATYYDAGRVYHQIADYTQNAAWNATAQQAIDFYRDQYVVPAGGVVPGYWNFTRGLKEDYLRTGDANSRAAALLLADNAAFARDGTPLEWTADYSLGREVAYAIQSYLDAEDLAAPRRDRLSSLVDQALGHFDQMFVSHTATWIKPFMVALEAESLIRWADLSGDGRVLPVVVQAADQMWDQLWVGSASAFRYISAEVPGDDSTDPAPDLNLLIAPMYAWLYRQTGEARFQQRGDAVFLGGVQQAYINNPKQFNQNYRWSFDFVRWRQGIAPSVRGADFANATGGPSITLRFKESIGGSFSSGDVEIVNLSTSQSLQPSQVAWDGSRNRVVVRLAPFAPDGNYRLKINSGTVTDPLGAPLPSDYTYDFFILAGDADHDRTVGFLDLVPLAMTYGRSGMTFAQGDFNYDGLVDFGDLVLLAQRYGTNLPAPADPLPAAAALSSTAKPASILRKTPASRFNLNVRIPLPRTTAAPIKRACAK